MSDLNNSLQGTAQKSSAATIPDSAKTNGYSEEQVPMAEEFREVQTPIHARDDAVSQVNDKTERKKRARPLLIFGTICIATSIAALTFFDSNTLNINRSDDAKAALANKISTALAAGTILLAEDQNIGEQDYTLAHELTGRNETRIWIWDYAAEDGDYVQVLINGVPYSAPFMIKHKPVMIPISMPELAGIVQVRGVRDGGGGITYAVRYELNNTTYFNSAPEGEVNTYTLVNTTK